MMDCMFLFVVTALILQVSSHRVTGISTDLTNPYQTNRRGSLTGGTRLYFRGEFDEVDPLLYQIKVGDTPCPVREFYTSASYIECEISRPALIYEHRAEISITYPGATVEVEVEDTSFVFDSNRTPFVYYVNPVEASPGDEVSFYGVWRTSDWDTFEEATVAGKQMEIFTLPEWESVPGSSAMNLTAVLSSGNHGEGNPQVRLMGGYGLPQFKWTGQHADLAGNIDFFRTIARMDQVTSHSGSDQGGLTLYVVGVGFPTDEYTDVQVKIEGNECVIEEVHEDYMKCMTGPQTNKTDQDYFEGGAGLIREVWLGNAASLSFADLIGVVEPDRRYTIATPQIPHSEESTVKSRMYGFFKPPITGEYVFYVACDDSATVYLSPSHDSANLTSILHKGSRTSTRSYFSASGVESSPLNLTANEHYYLEIRHSSNGGSHFSLGVKAPGNGTEGNRMPLVQRMTIKPANFRREVQQITLMGLGAAPSGGTFKVSFEGSTTKGVGWNAGEGRFRCEDIVQDLKGIGLSPMQCESNWTDATTLVYNLTFDFESAKPRNMLMVQFAYLQPLFRVFPLAKRFEGHTAISGQYSLKFRDALSSLNNYERDIGLLEQDLAQTLPTLQGEVSVLSGPSAVFKQIDFMLPGSMLQNGTDLIEVGLNNLTGGIIPGEFEDPPVIEFETLDTPGNERFWWVVPSEMLRTAETAPQIQLSINGTLALCGDNCTFVYEPAAVITSFSESGGTVSIFGTDLPIEIITTTVSVGNVDCPITSIVSSQIDCTLAQGEAGNHVPIVRDHTSGYLKLDESVTNTIRFELTIDSISPAQGATNGGTYLTITGTGFSTSMDNPQTVLIGEAPCMVRTTTPTLMTCLTSQQTGSSEVTITFNGETASSTAFTYDSTLDMTITSVTPSYSGTLFEATLTIAGTSFGTNSSLISVMIGKEECLMKTLTDTQIECVLLGGPKGEYDLVITKVDEAIAWMPKYPLVFEMTSISHTHGSIFGGTQLTITGNGFSTIPGTLLVHIGNSDGTCDVVDLPDNSTIVCEVPPMPKDFVEGREYEVYVLGRLQERCDCVDACTFKWEASVSPMIESITPNSATAGTEVNILGDNFGMNMAELKIMFDGVEAAITSLGDTNATVIVPAISGRTPTVTVALETFGRGTVKASFTNLVTINTISPQEISQGGGPVVIGGSGFEYDMIVEIGSSACTITEITNDSLLCVVAPYDADEAVQLPRITEPSEDQIECESELACGLTFTLAKTSQITGNSDNLLIQGIFNSEPTKVLVGDYDCTITSASLSTVECIPQAPPGVYQVNVQVGTDGYATKSFTYEVKLTLDTVTSDVSSYAGGLNITLTGTGLAEEVNVKVCDQPCEILSATGDELICQSPALVTEYSLNAYELTAPTWLEKFTAVGSAADSSKAFDDKIHTWVSDSSSNKWVGVDVGAGYKLKLVALEFVGGGSGRKNYNALEESVVEGSDDGTTWNFLYEFTGVHDYWNEWIVPTNQEPEDDYPEYHYRFYRIGKTSAGSSYALNELAVKGIRYSTVTDTDTSCTLELSYGDTSVTSATPIDYSADATPVITMISPDRGTAAGGTEIAITGSGLGTDITAIEVTVDGVDCPVSGLADSVATCTTERRPFYTEPSFQVHVAGKGYAVTQNITFLYSELWSDSATWGGIAPPREGETVWIPSGQNVILDVSPPILNLILVEGIFIVNDESDITLQAHYIMVRNGRFQVGTEEEPFQHKFNLIMHGNRDTPSLPIYGNKVLAVRNATLDIHGKQPSHSWTFLNNTAFAGDTTIEMLEPVSWEAGDEIVIASTSFRHYEAEVRTIASVDGSTVNLTSPLKYKHYADTETYGNETIDIRAEVGLLTRNIRVRGSDEGLWQQHGVHIMMTSPGDESIVGRIENMEIFYAGQAFSLGRYPIHFHMIGKVSKSYIRSNSIHHTYNRAITMHGIHYLRVQRNVAYYNKGHAFFVEDGIETKNIIEDNLGIYTVKSWSLLNTDQTPATFWITNFDNFVRRNHAAGADNYGFWYDPPKHPTGPSSTRSVCPEHVPLGEFSNNVAHSNGKYGLRIFHAHIPRARPCNSGSAAVPAEYRNFTAWKNKHNGAIGDDVGDVRFLGFKVADNRLAGIEMAWTEFSAPFKTVRIQDALVIGNSGNTEGKLSGARGIITAQTDGMLVSDIRFHNFPSGMYPLGDESKSQNPIVRDTGARLHKLDKLSFTNSVKNVHWEIPYRGIFHVLDDSFNGVPDTFLTAPMGHMASPNCTYNATEFNGYVCSNPVKRLMLYNPSSDIKFVPIFIARTSGDDPSGTFVNVTQVDADGNETTTEVLIPDYTRMDMISGCQKKNPIESWNIPVEIGHQYTMKFGANSRDFDQVMIEFGTFEGDEAIDLKMHFSGHREWFEAFRSAKLPRTHDPVNVNDTCGTFFWVNETDKYFEIKVGGPRGSSGEYGNILTKSYTCWGRVCSPPISTGLYDDTVNEVYSKKLVWSDPTIWPTGRLPEEGEIVMINSDWNLTLDVDTPLLFYVEVNGLLFMDPTKNVSLSTNWLFVRGAIQSGSEESPLDSNLTHGITLHGFEEDPDFLFDFDIDAGHKILAVVGKVEMYGAPKRPYTYLVQNAKPGEDFIFVDSVDWAIGDDIMIASSARSNQQHEVVNITDIIYDVADDPDWLEKEATRAFGRYSSEMEALETGAVPADVTTAVKLILGANLTHYHSGTALNGTAEDFETRTEVAVLTRNIKIEGNVSDWQCTILTATYTDFMTVSGTPAVRQGNLTLDNVEINNCGQKDNDKGAVRFLKSAGSNSRLTNNVIKNTENIAVQIDKSDSIVVDNNVAYNVRWRGITVSTGGDLTITNNLIANVKNRPGKKVAKDKPSGFYLCEDPGSCQNVQVEGNTAAGYDYIGFFAGPVECNSMNTLQHNRAHSGNNGYLFTYMNRGCVRANSLYAAWNDNGINVLTSSANVTLSRLQLVDNKVGITSQKEQSTDDSSDFTFSYSDVVLVGRNIHSQSWCAKRIGLYTPPLETAVAGESHWSNLQFYNFDRNACSNQYAISNRVGVFHYYIPVFVQNTTFYPAGSLSVYMNNPPLSWINVDDCGNMNCTALFNDLITDLDGSLVGHPGGGYILPNNPGIAKNDLCTFRPAFNAYICSTNSPNYYMTMVFESKDADRYDRTFSPINVTTFGTTFVSVQNDKFYNKLNSYMDTIDDGFYASQQRLTRFPSILYSGLYYNVSATGTLPKTMRFALHGTLGRNQPVILTLNYDSPQSVHVYANGEKIEGIEYSMKWPRVVGFDEPHGANRWYEEDSRLQFMMRSETPLTIKVVNSIRLMLELDMTVEEFFSNDESTLFIDRLAAVLNIPSYRIRIASAASGSAIVNSLIDEDPSNPGDLQILASLLGDLLQSGELAEELGHEIITASVTVDSDDTEEEEEGGVVFATPYDDSFEVVGEYTPMLSLFGFVLTLMTVAGLLYWRSWRNAQQMSRNQTKVSVFSPKDAFRDEVSQISFVEEDMQKVRPVFEVPEEEPAPARPLPPTPQSLSRNASLDMDFARASRSASIHESD